MTRLATEGPCQDSVPGAIQGMKSGRRGEDDRIMNGHNNSGVQKRSRPVRSEQDSSACVAGQIQLLPGVTFQPANMANFETAEVDLRIDTLWHQDLDLNIWLNLE